MIIINLTQHKATSEQIDAGVSDVKSHELNDLKALLTFSELPTKEEIQETAEMLAEFACYASLECEDDYDDITPTHAMIGGAPFLMSALEAALLDKCITPVYAFSERDSVEKEIEGKVVKTNIFKHKGFVSV